MKIALLLSLLSSASLFAQMEVGSVWKAPEILRLVWKVWVSIRPKFISLGPVSSKLAMSREVLPQWNSTWHDLSTNSVLVTYDPNGAAFGVMCPDDSTSFVYSINSNTMTLSNIQGSCSSAASILNNSTWEKVGAASTAGLTDLQLGSLTAYPNPAKTVLTLSSENKISPDVLKVYDLLEKNNRYIGGKRV